MFVPLGVSVAVKYGTVLAIVASLIAAFSSRSKVAYRETSIWAGNKLLVSFMVVFLVFLFRAVTKHWGRSHMTWTVTWTEIGTDLLIIIASYATVIALSFVWNFIFAPARLKRELKRKAGQASLDKVLTSNAKKAVKALNKLMDADEEKDE